MRKQLQQVISGVVLALSLPTFGQSNARPNLVLILADDLGYGSLACYGNTEVRTPNLDRLAASGMRFTDFHSNGALCSPTRAALMTGRYQQRCVHVADEELSPVFREQRQQNPVQRWAWGISTGELTLPAVLKQAGYRTALIGKWHLGYDSTFHPMNYGFEEFRGFVGGNVDYHTHVAGYGTKQLDWWKDRKIENEQGYSTELLTRYATGFIARNKDTPFFLYLAHGAPHAPLQGREPSRKKSPVETYKEMIGVLDESVGAVIEKLRAHHLESNTLVIFCSDNGPAAPRGFAANTNLRGKKGTLYEGGHRVPFIASWPGAIPPGTTSDALLMTMDLLPTLASLAGARLPADRKMDGIDILPILKGGPSAAQRDLHWQSGDAWAVRRGSWKLTGEGHKPISLVNLHQDIGETDNLLGREPARADELMTAHERWVTSLGD
jgi:arylsulfatase A-like enzyme